MLCSLSWTVTKACIHNDSNRRLYSSGVSGCHSPSCAGESKTVKKESVLKTFASTFFSLLWVKPTAVRSMQFPTDSYLVNSCTSA